MSVVRRFESAFNKQDVDGLVDCFTEDGAYTDTFFGTHRGHPSLRAMFGRMFREGRDYTWRMDTIVEDERHAAAEWSFAYVATEAVPRSAGRQVSFRGMSFFALDGERIRDYRECFDEGIALLQLGFSPDAIAKVLKKRL